MGSLQGVVCAGGMQSEALQNTGTSSRAAQALEKGRRVLLLRVMNLLSVARGTPLACGQLPRLGWPSLSLQLRSGPCSPPAFRRFLLESPVLGSSCLVCAGPLGPPIWVLAPVAPWTLGRAEGPGACWKHFGQPAGSFEGRALGRGLL